MAARTCNDIGRSLAGARGARWAFLVAAFALLLAPSVGLLVAPPAADEAAGAEKRELAPPPELLEGHGAPNPDALAEAGAWFEDHFAGRAALVDADARLYAGLFGVSTTDQVIVGREGWLYYGGTLADFQDRAPLRERQARNIAHNLALLRDWCEAQGARFCLLVAPDKNALYPGTMPYYYPPVASDDMERLSARLDEFGVAHADAAGALEAERAERAAEGEGGAEAATAATDALLYYRGDSHWNEVGALAAHDALAQAGGFQAVPFDEGAMVEVPGQVGDLTAMLYPVSGTPEPSWALPGVNDGSGATGAPRSGSRWRFLEGASVEDALVRTEPAGALGADGAAAAANGRLLMFRDSFGNSLVPYLACEFSGARFSKMLPYDALSVRDEHPSVVVVERAQRHVAYLAEEAPLMPCPRAEVAVTGQEMLPVQAQAQVDGSLLRIEGCIEGLSARWPEADVFVRLQDASGQGATYEAFALSDEASDDGFCLLVGAEAWAARAVRAQVLVGTPEAAVVVGEVPVGAALGGEGEGTREA